MFTLLLVLLIIVAVLMICLILLQKSEGSGMSGSSAASMFGGALTGAAAGNFLTRATAWLATIFFILCALLALVSAKSDVASQQSDLRNELIQQQATDSVNSGTPIVGETPDSASSAGNENPTIPETK